MTAQTQRSTATDPAPGMVALVDVNFRYLYVSAGSLDLFGQAPLELHGRDAFESVHWDDRFALAQFIESEDLVLGGRNGVVYRMVREDGSCMWVKTVARALDEEDPRYVGEHVLVHRVISEQDVMREQRKSTFHRGPWQPGQPRRVAARGLGHYGPGHPGLGHRLTARLADVDPFDPLLDRDWARVLINDSPMSVLLPDIDHFALLLAQDQPILEPEEASRRQVEQEAERAAYDAERAAARKATQDALWAVEREAVRRAREEAQREEAQREEAQREEAQREAQQKAQSHPPDDQLPSSPEHPGREQEGRRDPDDVSDDTDDADDANEGDDRPAGRSGDGSGPGSRPGYGPLSPAMSLRAQASFFSFGASRWHSLGKPADK
ncbi:PAS domain S-box protein [Robbsia sp. Bb-Pol-6]|uniref:PAS domain S-box protein n=1 Tax=Robbsia betulipollinis TaxID=2981849 RepID=A0ABT3ZSC6_9BURK|nr:PAS domain S-box protein [Robbsia betulipollinis]MCY0389453.1 PAS domain S-box protein [Robbsia betulipollinis]